MLLTPIRYLEGRRSALFDFIEGSNVCMALIEFLFSLVVSNFALIFAVFVYMVSTEGANFSMPLALGVIRSAINSAEAIVYILAVIAPAMWIMVNNWRARSYHWLFPWIIFVQAIIVIFCFCIYGMAKVGKIGNQAFVDLFASICFPVAVFTWYITVYFQRAHLDQPPAADNAGRNQASTDIVSGLTGP
ncbi:MAG: hypothetical protein WBH11_19945 [Stenotrophomonas geniculata]